MIQTDKLTGRALDAAVAERVMGLKIAHHDWPCGRDPETGAYVAAPSLEEARELSWLYYERGPIQACPRDFREPMGCMSALWRNGPATFGGSSECGTTGV